MTASPDPRQTAAWGKLRDHAEHIASLRLADLLRRENRFAACSEELGELCLDFSRARITEDTLALLIELAEELSLAAQIDALCTGATVNNTEGRQALHTRLRGGFDAGDDIAAEVTEAQRRFLAFADAVRSGDRTGHDGQAFETVINIGVGGSDLGPRFVSAALGAGGPDVHFVAGLDGQELRAALAAAEPATTLFIVCSKTFSTLETLTNAKAARAWLSAGLGDDAVPAHFAAVSVNGDAMDDFGVADDARFAMWNWVGGRYSVWSPVGLAAAIAIGSAAFRELLEGAAGMDAHFRAAELRHNIPVLHGLLAVWEQNFLGADQRIVLPYDERLRLLPDYLQQLWMESLGKSARKDGSRTAYPTGSALWGSSGSGAQHSFAQWLHQGSARAVVDYVGVVNGPGGGDEHAHLLSLANLLAQADVLANGFDPDEDDALAEHRRHPGNRPANLWLLRRLSPATLGALLACYEHSVYVQSVIWGINPFDQYGVEQGKLVARQVGGALDGDAASLSGAGRRILDWRDC